MRLTGTGVPSARPWILMSTVSRPTRGTGTRKCLPCRLSNARVPSEEIRLSPDGTRAFVSLQGKHFLVPVPRVGRETVDIKIQGRADGTPVPVKRMSPEGGDYLRWSNDGTTMT